MEGRRKVFLIQDMQHANPAFANKILKTLEEPPDHAILLVTAEHRAEVLPHDRKPVPGNGIAAIGLYRSGASLTGELARLYSEADLLTRLAGGRLGWAVEQLQHPERREERMHHLESAVAADGRRPRGPVGFRQHARQ